MGPWQGPRWSVPLFYRVTVGQPHVISAPQHLYSKGKAWSHLPLTSLSLAQEALHRYLLLEGQFVALTPPLTKANNTY